MGGVPAIVVLSDKSNNSASIASGPSSEPQTPQATSPSPPSIIPATGDSARVCPHCGK